MKHTLIEIGRADWLRQLNGIDVLVWRTSLDDPSGLWQMHTKLPLVEEMGIACFPSSRMLWFHDNKIRQTIFLQQRGYPIPETFASFDEADALQFARHARYPQVIKTAGGASASGVARVMCAAEAERIIWRTFRGPSLWTRLRSRLLRERWRRGDFGAAQKLAAASAPCERCVYFQEFIPAEFDWRITTLGEGLCSVFKRLNRPNDFRASGSGRLVPVGVGELPVEACRLAFEISESQRFTSMAYDFIESEGRFWLTEFSFSFVLNSIYTTTLFRAESGRFRKAEPRPVGVMHLEALLAEIQNAKPAEWKDSTALAEPV